MPRTPISLPRSISGVPAKAMRPFITGPILDRHAEVLVGWLDDEWFAGARDLADHRHIHGHAHERGIGLRAVRGTQVEPRAGGVDEPDCSELRAEEAGDVRDAALGEAFDVIALADSDGDVGEQRYCVGVRGGGKFHS